MTALSVMWDRLYELEREVQRAAEAGDFRSAASYRDRAIGFREAIEIAAADANGEPLPVAWSE